MSIRCFGVDHPQQVEVERLEVGGKRLKVAGQIALGDRDVTSKLRKRR
jgi:hypothetical protein